MAAPAASPSNIKVCLRVRPFAEREQGETCIVDMPTKQELLIDSGPEGADDSKSFTFDRTYWSHRPTDPQFATQETLMEELGNDFLGNALDGFNNCLFAYGQTGSGKTFSVLGGPGDQRGLLPRILEGLFQRIGTPDSSVRFNCKVSYLEIYNDNLRDLLVPAKQQSQTKLEVRHHPKLGVYVPGLSEYAVKKYDDVSKLLDFGQKARSVAATNMNATSSRSHCIFAFFLEKESRSTAGDTETKETLRSKVNLVDLAGSERQKKTGNAGERLKEGAMINKSLSNLAAVISKLAAISQKPSGNDFVPFRNAKLTHLLQESLSGNSKTVLIAAISPAKSNLDETLSTLRFAQTCKKVTTRAARNQESTKSVVEALKAEVEQLRAALAAGGQGQDQDPEIARHIEENEMLRAKLEDQEQTLDEWEELRKDALKDMGLTIEQITGAYGVDPNIPQLINISEDPSLSGNLVYYLAPGKDSTLGADKSCTLMLTGLGMKPFMCSLRQESNKRVTLTLLAPDGKPLSKPALEALGKLLSYKESTSPGRVLVNGRLPNAVRQDLKHTDRIIVGHAFCFRLVVPLVAADSSPDSRAQSGVVSERCRMEQVLAEIMHDHAEEFAECRAWMDSLQDRIGYERAEEFLVLFGRTLPLVEEANLITVAVRPNDRLRFQLECRRDIMTFTTDEPDLLIVLIRGTERGNEEVVVDVLELPQFMDRLAHIRDIYAAFQVDPGSLDFSRLESDPWMPCDHRDLQEVALEAQRALDEEIHLRKCAESRIATLERQLAAATGRAGVASVAGLSRGGALDTQDVEGQVFQDPLCAARMATQLLGNLQQLQLDIRGYAQQLQDEPVDSIVSNGGPKLPVEMPPSVTLPFDSKRGSPEASGGYY